MCSSDLAATGDAAGAGRMAAEKAAAKAVSYAANPAALEADLKRFRKALDALRSVVGETWGKDEAREPAPREYVKYLSGYRSRAMVDFDAGLVTVETLDDADPAASLRRADWYHGPSETIRLPLTGLKLVAYGVQAERPGWLHVRDLATFAAKDSPTPQRIWDGPGCDQPCLTLVEQAGTTVIARSEQGAPLVACQGPAGRRQVFSALAALPTPALCALLDESGVHRYVTQPGVLVQADSRLLMLHTKAGGPCTVHLPQPERLLDALSGEPMGQGRDITINLPAPSTLLLERLP